MSMNNFKQTPAKIGFVSLGCPKALVDSERIITQLRAEGYVLSPDQTDADAVIVNTCGFLDSAKEESLNAIGNAMKENGKVIVTGCMGKNPEEILAKYPNVLAITGPQQYEDVVAAVHQAVPPIANPYMDLVPEQGIKLTPRHYAYVKISEGCNNRCSFCIIPDLRGDLVSRPAGAILNEIVRLKNAGVREVLIISQDTSAYGVDLKYSESRFQDRMVKAKLQDLCEEMGNIGDLWTRLHYVYPYPSVDHIIPLMAEGKILPYLDIPFQHASPNVLRAMRRPAAQDKTFTRIADWRKICPDLAIRSTFIVGFPGETEEDFQFLLNWLDEVEIDRLGCFKYEAVSGAKANALPNAVPEDIKEERWHRLMDAQRGISERILSRKVGTIQDVIIDEVDDEGGADGRTKYDAPDVDGKVYLRDAGGIKQGDIIKVRIEESDEYDLYGVPV
jgi:ribosomal protein S12 methylthiotransferase